MQESESGGVVSYLYKDERGGPTVSRYRSAAIELMKKKCPQGYTITQEGETHGLSGISSLEGTEDNLTRRWAFQFRCKT